jgi:hypothetical protein
MIFNPEKLKRLNKKATKEQSFQMQQSMYKRSQVRTDKASHRLGSLVSLLFNIP